MVVFFVVVGDEGWGMLAGVFSDVGEGAFDGCEDVGCDSLVEHAPFAAACDVDGGCVGVDFVCACAVVDAVVVVSSSACACGEPCVSVDADVLA